MASISMVSNSVSSYIGLNSKYKTRLSRGLVARSTFGGPDWAPPSFKTESSIRSGALLGENGSVSKSEKNRTTEKSCEKLETLWDDGFGKVSGKDYVDASKELINRDGGPPRWFCPIECGQPLKDSPVLLFLPGIDGTGMGLILHHKPLGRVFEVRCLHIPVYDRTPFEAMVKLVEETVRLEHASSPRKPIYIVGDSFGGCLALAIAARNPTIDLVLILSNPATSFGRSWFQPILSSLEAFPDKLHTRALQHLLKSTIGETKKLAMAGIDEGLPLRVQLQKLYENVKSLPSHFKDLVKFMPRETLEWRLKMLKSAASYANSRLHAVKAEVLVLASGKDKVLPSIDEANKLKNSLKNCRVRVFNNNGHTLLLEHGVSLLRVIKGASIYRRSWRFDVASDFLPPSRWERKVVLEKLWFPQNTLHPVMLSTLKDGKIVRGLDGVPSEGPVLLVGNHLLMALESFSLANEFLCKKNIMLRNLGHPIVFTERLSASTLDLYIADWMKIFGTTPVTAANLSKLLSAKSHVVLYPGGTREGFHFKGEEHKLFWPERPEFVRAAAKFGATIVPFGVVGEDDLVKAVLDYDDLIKIPMVNDLVSKFSRYIRRTMHLKSIDEDLGPVLFVPKVVPGRIYFLFGKPIELRGREEIRNDRDGVNELYLQIKSDVEQNVSYLLKKREEDPYRNSLERHVYRMTSHPDSEVPTFEH